MRFSVWTIVGIIVYMGYGLKHSKLAGYPPESSKRFFSATDNEQETM